MKRRFAYIAAAISLSAGSLAFADGHDHGGHGPGRMRAGHGGHMMAAMQACIQSGKSMPECREVMMKNHRNMMGGGGCPMHDHSAPQAPAKEST